MPGILASPAAASPLAGHPAPTPFLPDPARLERLYVERTPDLDDPAQLVAFPAGEHRGSPLLGTFTESHVLAITQAICDFRHRIQGNDGPLYMGKDARSLSGPAQRTALQVLAANGVETLIQQDNGVTPAPVIARAVLAYNRTRRTGLADGIVLTPAHNPTEDGGIAYYPPHGGNPGAGISQWVESRANELLRHGNLEVHRTPVFDALLAPTTHHEDFVTPYVRDLATVVDMDAIKAARLTLAVDPLGGTTLPYWLQIAEHYGLDIVPHQTLTNRFHLAFAHDPDSDLQGVVTPSAGLMLPHHYLAAAVHYLLANRPLWAPDAIAGKTLFTSSIFDRVAHKLGRRLCETPPGFQWFAPGLFEGSLCVAGEEHGGVAFLQHDGAAWTTIPDGPVMNLLAAEITARTGRDPAELYRALTGDLGVHWYARLDAPATPLQKARLLRLAPTAVRHSHLAGQPILAKLNRAPGSNTPIGGLKVVAASGWFAARPSPSEDLYRIYAESFEDQAHLDHILAEAREIVKSALTDTLHG